MSIVEWDGPNWKPPRGQHKLDRELEKAHAKVIERVEKKKAKKRDGRCRWPEKHKCIGRLEAAHIVHASLGGEMHHTNLVTLCMWLHKDGPETQQYGQLRIDKETAAGANGALSFWRKRDGQWHLVAREIAPFYYERD